MNRSLFSMMMLMSVAGCSAADVMSDGDDGEALGQTSEALNGGLSPDGFLRKNFRNINEQSEALRQQDTAAYYNRVGTAANGTGESIAVALPNLRAFRTRYGFTGSEETTKYYNRGDLGLGREMHCVDKSFTTGEVACYVVNYASGRDGSEFTFGFSPEIAFKNMAARNDVATVAMVYRRDAPSDKVFFAVYDAADDIPGRDALVLAELTNAAPLDRHGLNFANAFDGVNNPDPAKFGTPGVNFNNHIPSNCLNCHGGRYTGGSVAGALFLPFDLDQFEYRPVAGQTRDERTFRALNQMVRNVAVDLGTNVHSVVKQIDGWYGNTDPSATLPATSFNSSFVPSGWSGANTAVYKAVVRPACRGCHMTTGIPFDDAASFLSLATEIGNDIDNHAMPHALQTQRLFWQSGQPMALETFLRESNQSSAANVVKNGAPDTIVTVDPHLIGATF